MSVIYIYIYLFIYSLTQLYLVHDLNLSKKEAELLGSRLKGWNLLHRDTEICFFRNRQNEFREFFSQENDLLFCNYVFSFTEALGHQHDPPEQRLFTGSSEARLKVLLLHNGKKFPSVPLAHAVT